MRHKGSKSFEFITRQGNIKLCGTYYHCGCSNSKSISNLVSYGKKFSHIANELVTRYSASNSYQQSSRYLRKDFHIYVSGEMLRRRILTISGQIKQIDTVPAATVESSKIFPVKSYMVMPTAYL